MKELREIIAKNIIKLRTDNKITQNELAKKLNYTDKSISKWERGESLPPIDILKQLADYFHVSLDFLVGESLNESYDKNYSAKENTTNKLIITFLAVSFVWLMAIVLFIYKATLFNNYDLWWIFIAAVPLSCIILLIFNCIWGKRRFTFIIISFLIWTTLTTIYCLFIKNNLWMIFIAGVPLQVGTILWSKLKTNKKQY